MVMQMDGKELAGYLGIDAIGRSGHEGLGEGGWDGGCATGEGPWGHAARQAGVLFLAQLCNHTGRKIIRAPLAAT